MVFELNKIKLNRILSFNFRGDGNMYVLGILGAVIAGSYFLTGGLIPQIDQQPENPQIVQIDPNKISANEDSLQLINLVPLSPSPTPTPSPIPTSTIVPSQFPTPTDSVEECLNNTVLTLMLDVSTSMVFDNKIGRLRSAMDSLTNKFKDEMVIGAVHFAGPASFPSSSSNNVGTRTLLPYTKFEDNRQLVESRLTNVTNQVSEFTPDGTYIANAFRLSINNIRALRNTNSYPDYQYVTVLFTDGVPEGDSSEGCLVYYPSFSDSQYTYQPLCFSNAQDPRPDHSTTLKSSTVSDKVYAIGLYTGVRERQALTQARRLLADVVSDPDYDTDTSNPGNLTALFDNILNSACE